MFAYAQSVMCTFVPLQKALGNQIRELRQRTGLKIEQLSEKSGLSSSRLSAIERGKVNLDLKTMLILTMSLDATLQDLFGCIDPKPGRSPELCRDRIVVFPKTEGKNLSKRSLLPNRGALLNFRV